MGVSSVHERPMTPSDLACFDVMFFAAFYLAPFALGLCVAWLLTPCSAAKRRKWKIAANDTL